MEFLVSRFRLESRLKPTRDFIWLSLHTTLKRGVIPNVPKQHISIFTSTVAEYFLILNSHIKYFILCKVLGLTPDFSLVKTNQLNIHQSLLQQTSNTIKSHQEHK